MKPKLAESIEDFNAYSSNADTAGVYMITDFKRQNGTLYMRSTISNPDAGGNYQTMTQVYYNAVGTTQIQTVVWTIVYDANGKIVSEVKS